MPHCLSFNQASLEASPGDDPLPHPTLGIRLFTPKLLTICLLKCLTELPTTCLFKCLTELIFGSVEQRVVWPPLPETTLLFCRPRLTSAVSWHTLFKPLPTRRYVHGFTWLIPRNIIITTSNRTLSCFSLKYSNQTKNVFKKLLDTSSKLHSLILSPLTLNTAKTLPAFAWIFTKTSIALAITFTNPF